MRKIVRKGLWEKVKPSCIALDVLKGEEVLAR